MIFYGALARFMISFAVSAIIIYLAVNLFDDEQKKGFGTAMEVAFYGSIIFAFASYIAGMWWIIVIMSTIVWLIGLGKLFSIGWLKSTVVAVVTLIMATMVSMVLFVITGPI